MSIIKSFFTAFSMYSAIPVPTVEWSEKNKKYALCFFPLVGAVIGAAFILWRAICETLGIGGVCFAAGAAALPVIISGGIHFDGFMDVSDALSSRAGKEKKLEIMKDPHVGAFALIYAVVYFALYFGFMTEIDAFGEAVAVSCSYVISRAVSAISITRFKCAKHDGLLFEFSSAAHIAATRAAAILYIILACAALVLAWSQAAARVMGAAIGFMIIIYYFMTRKNFGGITGDTAGWLVQMCELALLMAAAVAGRVI